MGCEVSKLFAARNNSTKKCMAELLELGLRPEEANHMLKLLNEQRFVTSDVIRDRWVNLLTPKLMDMYENYLIEHSEGKNGKGTVDVIVFSSFLYNFIKGTVEDRSIIYSSILKGQNECILVADAIEYLIELMRSVLLAMSNRKIVQYNQWSERGSEFVDENIRIWTLATISNVCNLNETNTISLGKIPSWITFNTDIIWLQCYLFIFLYELEKLESNKCWEHKSIQCPLPYLKYDSNKDDWRAILNIPSVIFISSHLPTENRYRWRLAYSADIHGRGFTTFRSSICNRGPTVLVIKDNDNHIFGGYASTSWHVGPQFFGDQRCFLFSLQPIAKIYPTLPHNDHFLYLNANQRAFPNGLGMGGQLDYWGLWIDESFEFGSCSPSCSTYAGYKMLSGAAKFTIVRLEVWCAEGNINDSEEDEKSDFVKQVGGSVSILHDDPAARALMDMLGKIGTGRDFLDNPN